MRPGEYKFTGGQCNSFGHLCVSREHFIFLAQVGNDALALQLDMVTIVEKKRE